MKSGRRSHRHNNVGVTAQDGWSSRLLNVTSFAGPSLIIGMNGSTPLARSNSRRLTLRWLFTLLVAACVVKVDAQFRVGPHVYEAKPYDEDYQTDILFDTRPPPMLSRMGLRARDSSSSTSLPSSILPPTGRITTTQTQAISTATAATQTSLPEPFDSNVGANFSSPGCANFFQSFVDDPTFLACRPLSLLLQTSTAFFSISHTPNRLTQTLDAACGADFKTCSALMAKLGRQIKQEGNCQDDAAMGNPVVTQAYNGFMAYQPLYRAGCLRNQTTGSYCFADAVGNGTTATSSYIYYLPLGVSLPAGTRPSCSGCLQNTMAIFQSSSGDSSSALSTTYGPAAQIVDIGCGPSFAAAPVKGVSSASRPRNSFSILLTTLLFALGAFAVS